MLGSIRRAIEKLGLSNSTEHYGERQSWIDREQDREFYGTLDRDREIDLEHREYGLPWFARSNKTEEEDDYYQNYGSRYSSTDEDDQ